MGSALKNIDNSAATKTTPPVTKRGGGAVLVYETIRDEILELTLAPGSALDESSLAARFSMSRSPIREALVKLAADGLVKTLANRSTIVAPIDLIEFPKFVAALDYVQRIVTRLAALHRTEADLDAMTAAAKEYDAECIAGNSLRMSEANKRFHMAVAKAGGNPFLTSFYGKLLDEGRRILHMHYARTEGAKDRFPLNSEHFDMIEAIRAHDEKKADQLANEHTRMLHGKLVEFMRVNYLDDLE